MVYQDTYLEASAKRKVTTADKVIYGVIWAFMVVVIIMSLAVPFFTIFILLDIWLLYRQKSNMSLAFDYSITNDELDIVRVRTKRKLILNAKVEDIEVLAPSMSDPVQRFVGNNMKTLDCTSHSTDEPYYTMIINDHQEQKQYKVLWQPSDDMIDYLKRKFPRNVYTRKDLHLDQV